jgi:hypothetical protein
MLCFHRRVLGRRRRRICAGRAVRSPPRRWCSLLGCRVLAAHQHLSKRIHIHCLLLGLVFLPFHHPLGRAREATQRVSHIRLRGSGPRSCADGVVQSCIVHRLLDGQVVFVVQRLFPAEWVTRCPLAVVGRIREMQLHMMVAWGVACAFGR